MPQEVSPAWGVFIMSRPKSNRLELFWSKVDLDGPVTKIPLSRCWQWTGSCFQVSGYGQFKYGDRNRSVHRLSWELHNGSIANDLYVRHVVCRNKRCVNPDHLALGTHRDNMDDMLADESAASGSRNGTRIYPERVSRGESHGMSKLTTDSVVSIRRIRAETNMSYNKLADMFGVSKKLIVEVVKRRIWKHLP